MTYSIYTDGSCRGNGQTNATGAWAYVILDDNSEIVIEGSGVEMNTTNNRMELRACIEGCAAAEKLKSNEFDNYLVCTDSAYIQNCYSQQWYKGWLRNNWMNASKKPVANPDLWKKLVPYFEKIDFSFLKVKGHDCFKWNNYVDEIVQKLTLRARR